MKEILFRGKAINRNEKYSYRTNYKNGDWVYGLLADVNDYAGFSKMTNTDGVTGIEVDTNTVGQYTGKELNGEKLFSGDIVETVEDYDDTFGHPATTQFYSVVVWDEENFCWAFKTGNDLIPFNDWTWECSFKVGNIFDNPELLEVQ